MSDPWGKTAREVTARGQTYFDGAGRTRIVDVRLADTLQLFDGAAFILAWALADIRRVDSPAGVLRVRSLAASTSAWCEIRDATMTAAIAERCRLLDGDRQEKKERVWRLAGTAILAACGLAALMWFAIPALADRIAPLVPESLDKRIGQVADKEARAQFPGGVCSTPEGDAALGRLASRLKDAAGAPLDVRVSVLSSFIPNAFALPGGQVYMLRGLIESARSPDEIAGVLAHEFGHVAHRDGLRAAIKQGGAALALGLVFGDMFGVAAIATAARASLSAAYSREDELQADDFAVALLARVGRSARPLGEFLTRVSADDRLKAFAFLLDHPLSAARLARIARDDAPATGAPLMLEDDWRALRSICDGRRN